jgi:hypothetical protein
LEGFGLLADQQYAVDAKARRLGLRDALNRCRRGCLQSLVNGALVLFAQGTLALLLTLLLDEGLWSAGELSVSPERSTQQHTSQHGTRSRFQFLSLDIFLVCIAGADALRLQLRARNMRRAFRQNRPVSLGLCTIWISTSGV